MRNTAILRFIEGLIKWDKRRSLCLGRLALALMRGGRLGVAAIGRFIPTPTSDKHHIKSVDRFLSNAKVDLAVLWEALCALAAHQKPRVFVLLDWTDLHHDRLETLVAAVSYGGRALPIAWVTARKGMYEKSRNRVEVNLCLTLKGLVSPGVEVVIVADRGFGRASFLTALSRAGIQYVSRIRKDVHLIHGRSNGPVANRSIKRGQTRDLPDALYGEDARFPLRAVITFGHSCGKNIPKQPWYLVTSIASTQLGAQQIVAIYKVRMRIEHNFRDHKSMRFGFQLRSVRLSSADRYDRLLAIAAIAMLFLVLIGSEVVRRHLDRAFRANTSKSRTHSLFSLGLAYARRHALGPPRTRRLLSCFDPVLEGMG
jgi:hypothetical protein